MFRFLTQPLTRVNTKANREAAWRVGQATARAHKDLFLN